MACTLHVAWDERLVDYHFGPGHPLAPVRVELTMQLARQFGLWNQPGVTVTTPVPARDADLELVHEADYVTGVEAISRWAEHPDASDGLKGDQLRAAHMFGLGTEDNPVFPGMREASALVAGATLAAVRAVWAGSARHGASIAGGMHHAMAAHASGFGVYNDPAIAIAWLLEQGAERVAYVDIDAHHGDGVQTAFYADPRVLTISLHQHPQTLFPFTGLPAETGGSGAEGSAVNVALPAGTGDASWLRAFHAIVPPLLRAFRPQILVS
jgi:acetoin utilization protein AcuC